MAKKPPKEDKAHRDARRARLAERRVSTREKRIDKLLARMASGPNGLSDAKTLSRLVDERGRR